MNEIDPEPPVAINKDTRFEHSDMSVAPIAALAVGILLYVTLTPFILTRLYHPAVSDVSRALNIKPPGPQLQLNTAADLMKFRAQKERELDRYGWVDRGEGIAHIPIAQAMHDVAARGISDFPKAQP